MIEGKDSDGEKLNFTEKSVLINLRFCATAGLTPTVPDGMDLRTWQAILQNLSDRSLIRLEVVRADEDGCWQSFKWAEN